MGGVVEQPRNYGCVGEAIVAIVIIISLLYMLVRR